TLVFRLTRQVLAPYNVWSSGGDLAGAPHPNGRGTVWQFRDVARWSLVADGRRVQPPPPSRPVPACAERSMMRVLLDEDQLMSRTAARRLLELVNCIGVVSEVARGDEIVAAALVSRSDVAVVYIEMLGQDGLSGASELRRDVPDCRML